jgi:hypothetical protein
MTTVPVVLSRANTQVQASVHPRSPWRSRATQVDADRIVPCHGEIFFIEWTPVGLPAVHDKKLVSTLLVNYPSR